MKDIILAMQTKEDVTNLLDELLTHDKMIATNHVLNKYGVESIHELQIADSQMVAFDCGWILWSFEDEELDEHMKTLTNREYGYRGNTFRLRDLPVQSTTMNSEFASVLQEKLAERGLEVSYKVHLD